MNLASELQQYKQENIIEDLLSHPRLKQLIRSQIRIIEQEQKTVQIGSGITKLVEEIFESINTLSQLKKNQQGMRLMQEGARIRKQIQEIKAIIHKPNFFEKVNLQEQNKINEQKQQVQVLSVQQSPQFIKLKSQFEQLKTTVFNFIQNQPDRQPHLNPEINSRMTQHVSKSISRKRLHTGSELFSSNKNSNFNIESMQKQFVKLVQEIEIIKQKTIKNQQAILKKYDEKILTLNKDLIKIETELTILKKQRQVIDKNNDSFISRMDSSRSFISKKSNKSGFSAMLHWK